MKHAFTSFFLLHICVGTKKKLILCMLFSCKGAALEVLMSVCLSVDKLKFEGFQKVP